jgi:DNA mismatch repair protein MutL
MGDVSPIPRNYSSSRPEFIRGDSCSYGVKQPDLIPKGEFSSLRAIGQLHNSFLLCEKEGGALVVIDQHAAHERIGYEKLKESYFSASVQSQGLLVPEVVSVSPKSVGYLESALDELNKIGWELEYFGGDNFCAKAVPAILGNINLKSVIAQLADDLSEYGKMDVVDDRLDLLMKVTACHAQIRAGDRLSNSEIEHLLKEMDGFDWSGRCPHGRPAVAEINLNDIEKWFNRT